MKTGLPLKRDTCSYTALSYHNHRKYAAVKWHKDLSASQQERNTEVVRNVLIALLPLLDPEPVGPYRKPCNSLGAS